MFLDGDRYVSVERRGVHLYSDRSSRLKEYNIALYNVNLSLVKEW